MRAVAFRISRESRDSPRVYILDRGVLFVGRQREGIHPRRAADNNMAEELKVVLRKSENFTYGFSLLGTAGLPHVIYDILENSPAAECGEVRVQCNYIYM